MTLLTSWYSILKWLVWVKVRNGSMKYIWYPYDECSMEVLLFFSFHHYSIVSLLEKISVFQFFITGLDLDTLHTHTPPALLHNSFWLLHFGFSSFQCGGVRDVWIDRLFSCFALANDLSILAQASGGESGSLLQATTHYYGCFIPGGEIHRTREIWRSG